jgi:hypothetical protein
LLLKSIERGIPNPIIMKARAIKDPNTLKNRGGAPKPLALQRKMSTATPMKPKMEMNSNMKSGGRGGLL